MGLAELGAGAEGDPLGPYMLTQLTLGVGECVYGPG